MTEMAIGIDAGSTTWKAVAINSQAEMLGQWVEAAEPNVEQQTERNLAALREQCGLAPDTPIAATGYGRKRVSAALRLTEITCHARGAFHRFRRAAVLIDVGGQDTKIIRFSADGRVEDFSMNDKCAAGTGRFLEVALHRLGVPLPEVTHHAEKAEQPIRISSTCTVFAESEVVSLLAQGVPVASIVMGLHNALASRVAALAGSLPPQYGVLMSGGVALNPVMVSAIGDALRQSITVVPEPQLVGALGAALTLGSTKR